MEEKKPKEPQIDLDDEYGRIVDNEMICEDEISLWGKLRKTTTILAGFGFVVPFLVYLLWGSQ